MSPTRPRTHRRPGLSVVVPVLNEADSLPQLLARLRVVVDAIAVTTELVFVDDGSDDATGDLLRAAHARDARVKIVTLSRNFGKESALAAGLRYATGAAVVLMDGDLQHPPELIPALLAPWREGYDVVFARRDDRVGDGWHRRAVANLFYLLFRRLSSVPLNEGAGDFRLLDRRVVDVLDALPERARFTKGLYGWVGFKQVGVPYRVEERRNGRSRHTLRSLIDLATDGITSFSVSPLRLAGIVGGLLLGVAALYTLTLLAGLLVGKEVSSIAPLVAVLLVLGGTQLLGLGILGEYLGRIIVEVKGRPLFLVDDAVGFASTSDEVHGREAARGERV